MKYSAFFLFMAMMFVACNKEKESNKLDGNYAGTFTRVVNSVSNPVTAQVSIRFQNGQFEGQSSVVKYPAICNGTYRYENNLLTVENACFFTADFDWSLIFKGEYTVTQRGDSLTLVIDRTNGPDDWYHLKRTP